MPFFGDARLVQQIILSLHFILDPSAGIKLFVKFQLQVRLESADLQISGAKGFISIVALTVLKPLYSFGVRKVYGIFNIDKDKRLLLAQIVLIAPSEINIVVSNKMLTVLCSVMISVLSRGEIVVERNHEGLTSVPRDINVEVTTLKLNENAITRLENNSFDYLVLLEELYMIRNGITFIESHALEKNVNLHFLDVYGHKLSVFPANLGSASHHIVTIDMQAIKNDMHSMESMQLRNFLRLRKIAVNNNNLQTGHITMQSLPSLEEMYASNCNLHVFPNLSVVPTLKIVQLHYNHFRKIPAFAIQNLTRLHTFTFMGSHVTYLPNMSHLVSLKKLVINDNELVAIPDLYHLPLEWIEWAGNPMDCSKSLCWARMWDDVKPKVLQVDVSSGSQLTCASPPEMAGLRLIDIHPVAMECYAGDSILTS